MPVHKDATGGFNYRMTVPLLDVLYLYNTTRSTIRRKRGNVALLRSLLRSRNGVGIYYITLECEGSVTSFIEGPSPLLLLVGKVGSLVAGAREAFSYFRQSQGQVEPLLGRNF